MKIIPAIAPAATTPTTPKIGKSETLAVRKPAIKIKTESSIEGRTAANIARPTVPAL